MRKHNKNKSNFIVELSSRQGILFHLAGIAAIIWFLVRVLPRPDRIRYPCQQMSISVAIGYIAFWSLLWSAIFHGVGFWIRRVKYKTAAIAPIILVAFVLIFSITSNVYAINKTSNEKPLTPWEPIPNEPIGTPKGVNPGRVVWVWNPDATEEDLKGYWWLKQNNNQLVIDQMVSEGIKNLAGTDSEEEAWEILFKHFNLINGNGERDYQPGEKIAIKINLNNCYQIFSYFTKDNDRDASPYVVKAILRQLIYYIGVEQKDITIYDASRVMPNWFYRRVLYKEFPSSPLVPEFPNIHYVDGSGLMPGREKVQPTPDKIYFADGTGLYRTLPSCVVDADYIINIPLLKRHPIDFGVTLSGKNFFGTWIEPVMDVHNYHRSAFIEGNPAPQTDLLAHEQIGGKTILYLGDGTFATKIDHRTIDKFEMYPFNNDWTNSLFFSQDPIAIDSVMYDFLHTEGTNPCEGSQNYLHQSAEPNPDTYDPENDGSYLSESLGVHEHWEKSVDIFSSDRYLGPSSNGIDFVAIGQENANPGILITKPKMDYLYINGNEITRIGRTLIIGNIQIEAKINEVSEEIDKVEFYINNELVANFTEPPYVYLWSEYQIAMRQTIKVIAYYGTGETLVNELQVWKI
ncbi:MAG: hypothetical protein AYK22_05070 [Thermoplasmatales archaeon SG8-52-3]|nr:MAG: hypothetical protein AYK22_05070 [Thermoplasmatales archaeon SG8-52-3]